MTTTNDDRAARREKMLDKVRKLLAMANHATANPTESETAMRQANAIMAEWGIEDADLALESLDKNQMVFGEAVCGWNGVAPGPGVVFRERPQWAGVLALGVARFTDTIASVKHTQWGELVAFRGERADCLLARWLHGVLAGAVIRESRYSGWDQPGEEADFCLSASASLQERLTRMGYERRSMYEAAKAQSQSKALMVVDRKAVVIAQKFGSQSAGNVQLAASAAALAGRVAGTQINIPAGRPIGTNGDARKALR